MGSILTYSLEAVFALQSWSANENIAIKQLYRSRRIVAAMLLPAGD